MNLYEKRPKRLFTFGCSFTKFQWTTWANIVGHELIHAQLNRFNPVEFYNYGKGGAGNAYISAMIVQADAIHKFTPDDLVMVCWSGIMREDYFDENTTTWHTPGPLINNPNQTIYSKEWLAKTQAMGRVNVSDFMFRSYTTIKTTIGYLKKTNAHHMQMSDIMTRYSSFRDPAKEDAVQASVRNIYKDVFEELHPCYFNTIWDGSIQNKAKRNKEFSPTFKDYHPTPGEHFEYLQKIFDHHWSDETIQAVKECDDDLRKNKSTIICEPRESCLIYS